MTNLAVLVGNTKYSRLATLECCHDDVLSMKQLIEATEKYDGIEIIENDTSDNLKVRIRQVVTKYSPITEIFFYFSGHGFLRVCPKRSYGIAKFSQHEAD
ncbi:MAG TPA: caspase family protein [Stellaceae bacterium]